MVCRASRWRGRELFGKSRCLQIGALVVLFLFVASCGSGTNSAAYKTGAAPAEIQVEEVPQGIRIAWSPVEDAASYTVFWGREPTEYKNYFNTTECSLIISGLSKGELHCFAVTSWGHRGESDYSREIVYVYDDDPNRSSAHLAKGKELMSNGLYPEANAYLSAAIRLHPESADAYSSRASLYDRMEEPDSAKKDRATAERLSNRKTASLELNGHSSRRP